MRRVADIVAKALSILLYPLFIPTYGMILYAYGEHLRDMPADIVYWCVAVAGTFVLTCALPLSAILVMVRRGAVADLNIDNAKERTMPYIYTVMGFCFWCYLLIAILHTPLYINVIAIGATVALGLMTLINSKWKISAHLTGIGGLVGGLMTWCVGVNAIPTWTTVCVWMAVSLLLMYARLWLNAHTPAQVICGWLLGIACTFVPYMIISYVG